MRRRRQSHSQAVVKGPPRYLPEGPAAPRLTHQPIVRPPDSFCQRPRRQLDEVAHSSIRTPNLVSAVAANAAPTGNPRAQAITPALVNTGHPSLSQRLIRGFPVGAAFAATAE